MPRASIARSGCPENVWDEVWAHYDAGIALPPPPGPMVPRQDRAGRRRSRMVPAAMTAAVLLMLAATAFAAAPLQAARGIADAFRSADRAAVLAAVDWSALRLAMPDPPATTPAERFLAGLSRIVQQQVATPDGLLALVQGRVGPGLPESHIEATGFGTARLTLLSTTEADRGVALSLALRDSLPPRWLVVAVEPVD